MKTLNPYKNYCPYDVGDLLYTKNPKLPKDRWPGTQWAPIYTFVYGNTNQQTIGSQGGTAELNLTVGQLPSHNHGIGLVSYPSGTPGTSRLPDWTAFGCDSTGETGIYSWTIGTQSQGDGEAINILPPYTTAYIWERTA